MTFILRVILT